MAYSNNNLTSTDYNEQLWILKSIRKNLPAFHAPAWDGFLVHDYVLTLVGTCERFKLILIKLETIYV